MLITSIHVKNFRCFTSKALQFAKPLILIEGPNGCGKTSLLEALAYSCSLKSFRTRTTREVIQFGSSAFSIKVQFSHPSMEGVNTLNVGYSAAKKALKLNDVAISSYKNLVDSYRVIPITEDDLYLIKGSPEARRSFLDQAIVLTRPEHVTLMRRYNAILEQRNALLSSSLDRDSYELWTEQLNTATLQIREQRNLLAQSLEKKVNEIMDVFFDGALTIQLSYKPKEVTEARAHDLIRHEYAVKHSLIGAHLDDCSIMIEHKASKQYASRGQQKLACILLKIAQPATQNPESCAFLLDDVVSDLDEDRLRRLFKLLTSYGTQIIITSPLANTTLQKVCSQYSYEHIYLAPSHHDSLPNTPSSSFVTV